MKLDKKFIESGIVAALTLAVVSTTTLTANGAALANQYDPVSESKMMPVKTPYKNALVKNNGAIASTAENEIPSYKKQEGQKRTAGASNLLADGEQKKELNVSTAVKAQSEENSEAQALGKTEKKDDTKENQASDAKDKDKKARKDNKNAAAKSDKEKLESKWKTKLLPNVDEYLNVRAEANSESPVVGKLYKGDLAVIVEAGKEWTKITSGNVEGYVKNEFCVFSKEAEHLAKKVGTTYATALTDGLRVRAEASSDEGTRILEVIEKGNKIKVDTAAKAAKGWVAVKLEDEQRAYISKEFVDVSLELGKGITIEEEQAAIEAARAKAEEDAAKAAASADSSSQSVQNESSAASNDELTLLGALIQCEAGGESYDGQVAVGAVVMNRLRSGYAGSISGVIYQSGQFTPVASGALASALASGVRGSCLQAAQQAINGADNVSGAKNFRQISSGHTGIVIGNHVFF